MELSIQKFRYENLAFGSVASSDEIAIAESTAEVKNAQKLAEKIAEEVKPSFNFSEEELEALKKKVFAEGKLIGAEEVRQEQEKAKAAETVRIEELLQKMNAAIAGESVKAQVRNDEIATKLVVLAFAAAKKAVGELGAAGEAKIENYISQALKNITPDHEAKILLNAQTAEKLQKRLEGKEFGAKVVVDDSIMPNDFKIVWNNGYAERKLDELWKEIGQVILAKFDVNEFAPTEEDKLEPQVASDAKAVENNVENGEELINKQSEE